MQPRTATISRQTGETNIELELAIDGAGAADVSTGVGFLDHMLTLWAKHGLFDLRVRAAGDLHIDEHHTAEDTCICLGRALDAALGDRKSTRLNSSHVEISYAVFCLKKKTSKRSCPIR